jgi:hypothetical protein
LRPGARAWAVWAVALSAVPLAILLAGRGWTPAFISAAGAGVFVAIVALVALRDSPRQRISSGPSLTFERLGNDLSGAWRQYLVGAIGLIGILRTRRLARRRLLADEGSSYDPSWRYWPNERRA